MRIKCIVAYDGTDFSGWQIQPDKRSVQEEIQKAIEKVTGVGVTIYGSGRTDAGVHASGQVFHFDSDKDIAPRQWERAINHFLPEDIRIYQSEEVPETFHARYSAQGKVYTYTLSDGVYRPWERHHVYQYPYRRLDENAMREAAKMFLGEHDFSSYCVTNGSGNAIRRIDEITVTRKGDVITMVFKGSGFRRYMVRLLTGALIQVGAHRRSPEFFQDILDSRGGKMCLFKAEPQGLSLTEVIYDEGMTG